ncbi:potassium-transporting ATPase subunit KdpA [Paludibacter jiangxiensis]|uniref:Potassium-transporting ATPase potassium-binding subunit n=1 Tax=Paludibacter jiangxiensis TaxID=681398 RepID=A0A170ZCC5_9BACT|nr:potassium-transporting ATPase subunit KdpA [Paludibacter jiangxiensis]GAT62521.1 K+-transporting ATPase ATPase A chain [Paludibacter jiangxiensis]
MNSFIQLALFFGALVLLTPVLGKYIKKVIGGEKHLLTPVFGWLERLIYRFCGVDPQQEMNWKQYLFALLWFNFFGFVVVFALQMTQAWLPLNPAKVPNTSWHLALNTAISFVTNTNWQSYSGETTMSYLTQMAALGVQNFLSAATGLAVLIALMKGLIKNTKQHLGNFWVDLTRSVIYILLPLSIIFAVVLVSQGVVQTFSSYTDATTLEGVKQVIPLGPAASQIAIKQLGTNGGGFFGVNSAHPFENPTPFSNFLEMLAILLIPAALTYTYGLFIGSKKQGWTLFGAMLIILCVGLGVSLYAEYAANPALHITGSMEGKETRFGIVNSIIWSTSTTVASNGSVNAMHDSLSPLAGLVAMFNMMLGEVVFGGVGSGLYGMIAFVILTVFIAGLMVGRTPEYLGKKIESFEVRMALIAVLAPAVCILAFTAIAVSTHAGLAGLNNKGPHGLSEILYAFTSACGNNGSAFAGLTTNTPFYNVLLSICMLVGRFGVIIPMMAIAGSMAGKKITPVSSGTFHTDNGMFLILLIGVIIIVGGLTFFPALSLGPILEHLLMQAGMTF